MLDTERIYEALLYWRGNLNASEFARAIGRTRQHVQTHIIAHFPKDRMTDIETTHGHRVGDRRKHGRTLLVRPKSAPNDLWSFFGLLTAERTWRRGNRLDLPSLADLNIVDIAPPDPGDTAVWMCRAAAQKRVLVGHYLFKRHGVRAVRFSPHAMIRTPRRIHFRGHLLVEEPFEMQDWGYVDLVPGRLDGDGYWMLAESEYRGAEGDFDWHERTEIAFEVNPALPREAFLALQQEHGIRADEKGRCRIELKTRKALIHYYEHHVYDRTIGPERMKVWVRCSSMDN